MTVYGPAKIEQASPWKPPQLAKKTEFSAEYCLASSAALADEAIGEDGAVGDFRAGADDEVMGEDTRSDINGVLGAAIDGAVFEPAGGLDGRGGADFDVFDDSAIDDFRPRLQGPSRRYTEAM